MSILIATEIANANPVADNYYPVVPDKCSAIPQIMGYLISCTSCPVHYSLMEQTDSSEDAKVSNSVLDQLKPDCHCHAEKNHYIVMTLKRKSWGGTQCYLFS